MSDSMRNMGQFASMSAELLPSEANGLGIASALDVEDALNLVESCWICWDAVQ